MKRSFFRSSVWFVVLWCIGVTGAVLIALPFRILAKMAMQSMH
jgi:hypothetical protein